MKEPESRPLLIFSWSDTDHSNMRLMAASGVTLLGLALLFIVFRVVYPDTQLQVARPEQVLVLNPADPAQLALIRRVMDRSFALLPTTEDAMPGRGGVPLAAPPFVPSFQGHSLKLKELVVQESASRVPRLFALDQDTLPPLAPMPVPLEAATPTAGPVLRMMVESGLEQRAPTDLLVGAADAAQLAQADLSGIRFQVAVGPLGQVLLALPLADAEAPAVMERLHGLVAGLRFSASEKQVEWTQVVFRWQEAAAP